MAKKRDYKAEYARRQQLARERGHESYGKQRGKIERGEIASLAPKRLRSKRTRRNQVKWYARSLDIATEETRGAAPEFMELYGKHVATLTREERARDWSNNFAQTELAQYMPVHAKELGLTKREYTDLYLAAFVVGDQRYANARYDGSDALAVWFVDLNEYFTQEEYDGKYGSDK